MEKSSDKKRFWTGGFLTLGILRDILIVVLLLVITWKLLHSDISISFQSFRFSELLSVLFVFFAIALSAAFYFKAIDTSHNFYDNTYKFTKEVSEILGRIEAGFGERLKHIDEGYTGLRDKFDKMPFDITAARKEEKKEEKNIKEQENERNQIILNLMKKARVADDEKDRLLRELESHSNELDNSKMDLRHLQRKINMVESDTSDVPVAFIEHLSSIISRSKISQKYSIAPASILRDRFKDLLNDERINSTDLNYMLVHNLVDADNQLTSKGTYIMREAITHVF